LHENNEKIQSASILAKGTFCVPNARLEAFSYVVCFRPYGLCSK